MTEKPDIVQIRMGQTPQSQPTVTTKAMHIKVGTNKSVIIYNHINGYILDAFLKAVFSDDNRSK
ncbi:hypothetical protein AYR62_04255 [Secundilactobacillus paracollinoides]|uniref:Uncharacterized protein n=1 Tax=Secundilactobacillus paracollinoides TaxID=240427 RepID=A0A1B2J026_9LACO|nr:hypothetical protein [Secundilactobacillus paracollinoides]ANZ60218.1 hypothetical protein AYR61_01855 [Secundilactobacillus paracollinoides]ANZ61733.1 hypothetical protein AYR61_10540 [Secundilactobacillus paracollinoides]ANZ62783.1 hypothetical protein AYR62_00825 [Secundilactobacillus paracollinoides]ANZ62828.1 hypothetical protein AYR62_01065 [Secundilactobacillus paracollinoides]ANZ63370.1 hypothetical protein AYR62_04255 [Secundilactobacillus paracollinoides]